MEHKAYIKSKNNMYSGEILAILRNQKTSSKFDALMFFSRIEVIKNPDNTKNMSTPYPPKEISALNA